MKRALIIVCLMILFGSSGYAQSKPNESRTVPAGQEQAARINQTEADEYQRVKSELEEAQKLIGQYTIYVSKLEKNNKQLVDLLEMSRQVLRELANAETIEERDKILAKYQIKEADG